MATSLPTSDPNSGPAGTTADVRALTPAAEEEPTIGRLVADASRDISSLVQNEIALAKSELKVSAKFGGMAAGLFALFSIPIFLVVREPRGNGTRFRVGDAMASWSQLRTTIADARQVPGMLRFLVARFFYTDPVNTVIVIMAVFATEAIGFTRGEANLVLLALTVAAVLASFFWGWLVERIGPKRTLMIVLGSWAVGLVIAGAVLSKPTFLIAGVLLGSGLGGVWTCDRVHACIAWRAKLSE